MSGKFGRDEGEIPDEKEVIRRQIDALRAHIYSHIIWYKSNYLHQKWNGQRVKFFKYITYDYTLYFYFAERNIHFFKRYDYETIFYTLLRAADEAVAKTRKKWTPSIGIITI